MTAKEAAAESERVAEQVRLARETEKEKERLAREKELEYWHKGAVDFLLHNFYNQYLPDAIKGNLRYCTLTCHNPVTPEIAKDRLMAEGYQVSRTCIEYIPAYDGSCDNGYAYAHDAYTEYCFAVSW